MKKTCPCKGHTTLAPNKERHFHPNLLEGVGTSRAGGLIRSYELSKLPARLLHLQANTAEITGGVGSNNQNEVAYLSKLDCPALRFNDHVMHVAVVNLICEICNRAKDGCRHSAQHFLILTLQRS